MMNYRSLMTTAGALRAKRRLLRFARKLGLASTPAPVASRPKRDIWSIGIYRGPTPFAVTSTVEVRNPVLTGQDVSDVPAIYVADPFLIRNGNIWFMYFEVLNRDTGKGDIGLAQSSDGLSWRYRQIVLTEPFHLSYPYVFRSDGAIYMVPETYQANAVRLYRADDFPTKWSLATVLLDGIELVDSSPFFFRDRWWMLAGEGTAPKRADGLRLFHADTLLGPWREHPRSPLLSRNAQIARPAGRVLVHNGRVFRWTQNCEHVYGQSVRVFEITDLTEQTYAERECGSGPVLEGSGQGWNAAGMHHIDPQLSPDGSWHACVDGWCWQEASE